MKCAIITIIRCANTCFVMIGCAAGSALTCQHSQGSSAHDWQQDVLMSVLTEPATTRGRRLERCRPRSGSVLRQASHRSAASHLHNPCRPGGADGRAGDGHPGAAGGGRGAGAAPRARRPPPLFGPQQRHQLQVPPLEIMPLIRQIAQTQRPQLCTPMGAQGDEAAMCRGLPATLEPP